MAKLSLSIDSDYSMSIITALIIYHSPNIAVITMLYQEGFYAFFQNIDRSVK